MAHWNQLAHWTKRELIRPISINELNGILEPNGLIESLDSIELLAPKCSLDPMVHSFELTGPLNLVGLVELSGSLGSIQLAQWTQQIIRYYGLIRSKAFLGPHLTRSLLHWAQKAHLTY